jgi:hypothetical protein
VRPSGSGNSTGTNTGMLIANTQYSGLVSNTNLTGDATEQLHFNFSNQ